MESEVEESFENHEEDEKGGGASEGDDGKGAEEDGDVEDDDPAVGGDHEFVRSGVTELPISEEVNGEREKVAGEEAPDGEEHGPR